MNKQKLLVCAALALACSGVYAGTMGAAVPCKTLIVRSGPYVGLTAGVIDNVAGASGDGTVMLYNGLEGTGSLGWGRIFNQNLYIAAEIYGGSSGELKNYGSALLNSSARSNWVYGIDVLPGLLVNDNLLMYGRVGALSRNFNDIQGSNTQRTGWRAGLGLQTNVYKRVDLRAEYIFSRYQQFSGISSSSYSKQANLGLVFKFA